MVLDGSKEASLPSCGDKTLPGAPTESDTFDRTVEDFFFLGGGGWVGLTRIKWPAFTYSFIFFFFAS